MGGCLEARFFLLGLLLRSQAGFFGGQTRGFCFFGPCLSLRSLLFGLLFGGQTLLFRLLGLQLGRQAGGFRRLGNGDGFGFFLFSL